MVTAIGVGSGKASAQAVPPVANPGGPYAGVVGQLLRVTGAASTGFNLTFLWAWGDGTSSPGPVAAHAYGAAKTYTITLTVTDGLGRTNSATTTAVITGGAQNVLTTGFFPGFKPGFFPGFFGFGQLASFRQVGGVVGTRVFVPGVGFFICTTVNVTPLTCQRTFP
jgi:hypothetical protein